MKLNLTFLLPFIFFVFVTNHVAHAQNKGVLKGVITDKNTGSSLPGATIFVNGTNNGTITNVEGEYTLSNVPAGKSTIVFSFVSYKTDSVNISINEGETQILNKTMSTENIGLEEVVISAQLLGQKKAISQQLNSDAIVNVVSEDKIKELPDVNAAEAIARLPGIAINRSGGEGSKIVIRGMEPKYASITVNGVKVPSNASGDRSVDLSLISPELLSGIEVFKAPLPNMEAESSAGTVNLKLRKAPKKPSVLAKGLLGHNKLASEFKDYKGVLQASNRFFENKLGVMGQIAYERFNRSGDAINYNWSQGSTDNETGITGITGNVLTLNNNQEIRKRINGSVNLDYDLNKNHSLAFFGLFSRTNRDRFLSSDSYEPNEPAIIFYGNLIESSIDLKTFSLSGEHDFVNFNVSWGLSSSQSEGLTPYDYDLEFRSTSIGGLFNSELNRDGHPKTYLESANLNTDEIYLYENNLNSSNTKENTNLAYLDFKLPIQIADKIKASLEFGGRYSQSARNRNYSTLSERFYYLGTDAVRRAQQSHQGELSFIPSNTSLISVENFTDPNGSLSVELEDGSDTNFPVVLDPDKLRSWTSEQSENFTNTRFALVNNYEIEEKVSAGYAMLKLNFGSMLTLIPGIRYEYSNNSYMGAISSADGTYGQNGEINDTTTYQNYGEFFPHLHLKFKPSDWFDIRASYAKTIARPDFIDVVPTSQINRSNLKIAGGNPNLEHALSTSYDLNFSFFKNNIGLFTIGGFYKNVENVIIPRTVILVDENTATNYNWPGNVGYELKTHTNIPQSKVWGYEMEAQTNLSFLPQPFKGIILSANYSRLYSETEVFFLTSETVFKGGFPPIPVTTYTENSRTVSMPSQAPRIFRASIGYDYKGFSARVSGSYQGTKARSYSLNKDFDSYDLEFWRWDASAKQKFGDHWSIFLNLNNFSNQKDIRFTRTEQYTRTIETYGFTGTLGAQFKF